MIVLIWLVANYAAQSMSRVKVAGNDEQCTQLLQGAGDALVVAYFTATWCDILSLNVLD